MVEYKLAGLTVLMDELVGQVVELRTSKAHFKLKGDLQVVDAGLSQSAAGTMRMGGGTVALKLVVATFRRLHSLGVRVGDTLIASVAACHVTSFDSCGLPEELV